MDTTVRERDLNWGVYPPHKDVTVLLPEQLVGASRKSDETGRKTGILFIFLCHKGKKKKETYKNCMSWVTQEFCNGAGNCMQTFREPGGAVIA